MVNCTTTLGSTFYTEEVLEPVGYDKGTGLLDKRQANCGIRFSLIDSVISLTGRIGAALLVDFCILRHFVSDG